MMHRIIAMLSNNCAHEGLKRCVGVYQLCYVYLLSTSIIHEHILTILHIAYDPVLRERQDAVRNRLRASQTTLQSPEVAHKPGHKRGGHAGAALHAAAGVAKVVRAHDLVARRPDVQLRTVVTAHGARGAVNALTLLVGVADGERLGEARRRRVANLLVLVSSSDDSENSEVVEGLDGGVEGGRGGARTEAHAEDGRGQSALGLHIFESPVETSEDGGHGGAASVEDFHIDEGDLLCGAVGLAPKGTRDVGAVARAVVVSVGSAGGGVGEGVDAEADAAFKFFVGGPDSGVEDIGGCSFARAWFVDVCVSG
jgi:hypothetical protein